MFFEKFIKWFYYNYLLTNADPFGLIVLATSNCIGSELYVKEGVFIEKVITEV